MDNYCLNRKCPMSSLGEILKHAREESGLILRKVSAQVDIDQSLISKFEKDERKPTKEQIKKLSKFYGLSEQKLLIDWHSDKIVDELKYSTDSSEILYAVKEKLSEYKINHNEK